MCSTIATGAARSAGSAASSAGERLRPAGRRADQNELRAAAMRRGAAVDGRRARPRWRHRGRETFSTSSVPSSYSRSVASAVGLDDEIDRAERQRLGAGCAVDRRDADDDHARASLAFERAQHAEPVSAGHRQIERDDVGVVLGDLRERVVAVARGPDHVDRGRAQHARSARSARTRNRRRRGHAGEDIRWLSCRRTSRRAPRRPARCRTAAATRRSPTASRPPGRSAFASRSIDGRTRSSRK